VGGDASQMHAPGAVLDEEQHGQAAQEHSMDVEEVRGEDRRGLPGQERLPGQAGPSGRGVDARVFEDLPYGRRRDDIAEAGQLAVDAPIAPGRVIARHLQRQSTQRLRRAGPPDSAARVRPAPPDQISVPAQQGTWRHDQAQLADVATR
jgi:hypothetical protein